MISNLGGNNMSYDFKPTQHIGYTAQGYLIGTPKPRKIEPKRQGPFVDHSDGALRIECAKGNPDAIAEFEYRLSAPRPFR